MSLGHTPVTARRWHWRTALIAIALAIAIAPFLILSFFNHPQNDDYVYAAWVKAMGFLPANRLWFLIWSGRYLTTAVLSASPLVFESFLAFKFIAFLIIACLFQALYFCLSSVTVGKVSRPRRLVLTLILLALYLFAMPTIAEGVYWMAGAVCYQLGNILLLALAGLTLRRHVAGPGSRGTSVAALLLCLVLAVAGTNELSLLYMLGLLAFVLALGWLRSRRLDRVLASALLLAFLAAAIVVLAPGNQERFAQSKGHELWPAVRSSVAQGGAYLAHWLTRTPLLPVSVLLFPAFSAAAERAGREPLPPTPVLLLLLGAYFASFFLSYYGAGTLEPRTVNVIYLLFLVAWFAGLRVIAGNLASRRATIARGYTLTVRAASWTALALMTVLPSSNLRSAYADILSGAAVRYDRELNERYASIRSCPSSVCDVAPLTGVPKTLYFFENALDEKGESVFYRNYKDNGFAIYFGKRRIRLREPATYDLGHP